MQKRFERLPKSQLIRFKIRKNFMGIDVLRSNVQIKVRDDVRLLTP